MAKGKILKEIKELIYELRDNNMNRRVLPLGRFKNLQLGEEKMYLLNSFIDLLMKTDVVCTETKLYISNRFITLRGVNDVLNEVIKNGDTERNVNTTSSKIGYDQKKLERIFGDSMIADVLFSNKPLEKYTRAIILEASSRSKQKYYNDIIISLPKTNICMEATDEEFNNLVNFLLPYLAYQRDTRLKALLDQYPNSIGYLNFLLSSPIMKKEDEERRDLLIAYMTGEYKQEDSGETVEKNDNTETVGITPVNKVDTVIDDKKTVEDNKYTDTNMDDLVD